MARKRIPEVRDEEIHARLRDEGYGRAKAAAISNTQAEEEIEIEKRDRDDAPLESRTVADLNRLARKRGIDGYAKMTRAELINALRDE